METKRCTKCWEVKPLSEFSRDRFRADGHRSRCKGCQKEYRQANPDKIREQSREHMKKYRQSNPEKAAWSKAKERAKKVGVPFTILPEDIIIPEYCPVLGIKLERAQGYRTDASPSLDRIIPELGYVKGNIVVMSWRANRIKNDGTAEELERIAFFLRNPLLAIGLQPGLKYSIEPKETY